MKHLPLFFLMLLTLDSFGQYDSIQVSRVLQMIYSEQQVDDAFYDDGLFSSQRQWKKEVMEDNTFYYTACIVYILENLREHLSTSDQAKVDSISSRASRVVWKYANRKGEASYNFWQTHPDTPHPNGKAKHQRKKHGLPDDLDDTSVIGSVIGDDSLSLAIRDKMAAYAASNNDKEVKKTPKFYRTSRAYRTWYADKWTQDINMVVVCNILQFVFENEFELNEFDLASISFLIKAVERKDYLNDPEQMAYFYGRSSVISYHLARLLEKDNRGALSSIKPQIVADLYSQLSFEQNEYERLMLFTSLYRLGESPQVEIDELKLREDQEDFYFFYATSENLPFSGFRLWLIRTLKLVPSVYWKSEAFNRTLILEFLVETEYKFNEDPLGGFNFQEP